LPPTNTCGTVRMPLMPCSALCTSAPSAAGHGGGSRPARGQGRIAAPGRPCGSASTSRRQDTRARRPLMWSSSTTLCGSLRSPSRDLTCGARRLQARQGAWRRSAARRQQRPTQECACLGVQRGLTRLQYGQKVLLHTTTLLSAMTCWMEAACDATQRAWRCCCYYAPVHAATRCKRPAHHVAAAGADRK
jgi:hypothetical protein